MKKQIISKKNNELILLIKLWKFFSKKRKIQFFLLLVLMLLSGFAEMISFTAIIPFLTVLTDPERLIELKKIQPFYKYLNLESADQLLTPIAIVFILITIFAASIKLSSVWLSGRYAASLGSEISCKSYSNTLLQPYDIQIEKNTSAVISTNTTYLNSVILVFHQTLWFISNLIISFLISIGLFIVNYKIAFILLLVFTFAYLVLMLKVKSRLMRNSQYIANANQIQVKIIQESLGSIRDIILNKAYKTFIDIYKNIDINMRFKNADSIFLSIYPRNVLEVLGISFLVLISLIINGIGEFEIKETLPLLGAFALGAQRLLPAMQQSYNAWATVNSYSSEIRNVINSLEQNVENKQVNNYINNLSVIKKSIKETIEIKSLSFRYSYDKPYILKDINFVIKRGERIGIKGITGSGKSTLIDIIMGLLKPTNGKVLVDGDDIHSKRYIDKWHKNITHVPQNIYLTDSSFAKNIAFGLPDKEINMDKVKEVSKKAHIASFIESSNQNYKNRVGEKGIKLSGGQRQRIGIARALYKQTDLIILDEATSALDKETEKKIMDSIKNLNPNVTILVIAHRLSTLDFCDKIIELRNGHLFEKKNIDK